MHYICKHDCVRTVQHDQRRVQAGSFTQHNNFFKIDLLTLEILKWLDVSTIR